MLTFHRAWRGKALIISQSGSKSFESARDGLSSPLAKRLFAIDGVAGVFYGSDFVTVTKSEEYVWSVLKPEIFAAIMEHFTSGMQHHEKLPVFMSARKPGADCCLRPLLGICKNAFRRSLWF